MGILRLEMMPWALVMVVSYFEELAESWSVIRPWSLRVDFEIIPKRRL